MASKEDKEETLADVVEYRNGYEFVVNMPGIPPGEIDVLLSTLRDNYVLVVRGRDRDRDEVDNDGAKYLTRERHVGKFGKTLTIPREADLGTISAFSKDGVLSVTIQKLDFLGKKIRVMAG